MPISKEKLKLIQVLKTKKGRENHALFLVEGEKMVLEVLKSDFQIHTLFALADWKETHAIQHATIIDDNELKAISSLTTPNKVLAIVKMPTFTTPIHFSENTFSLYLDGIQDPGNMGTILRTADWFGIKYVFCSDTCVDIWSPKVIQATMGAFLRVHSQEVDFFTLPKMPTLGMVLGGENVVTAYPTLPQEGLIVIGSEGKGISPEILKKLDFHLEIPRKGNAESLNAAVATGIICAMLVR